MRFSDRMSDHEALMWNIEKDPWLNPSGAALTILQGSIDDEHFRRTLRRAVAKMPRLYERVVPGLGRLAPPAWVPDPEFDLDYHMRRLRLPKPGTDRQLFDLAAQLYQEPLDRTRPLWRFVVIDGLEGGRSAIWSIVHHAVSRRHRPAPHGRDVPAARPRRSATRRHRPRSDRRRGGGVASREAAGWRPHRRVRRHASGSRLRTSCAASSASCGAVAGEVVIWPADPQRARDTIEGVLGA